MQAASHFPIKKSIQTMNSIKAPCQDIARISIANMMTRFADEADRTPTRKIHTFLFSLTHTQTHMLVPGTALGTPGSGATVRKETEETKESDETEEP